MIKVWTKYFEKLLSRSDMLVKLYDLYYKKIVKNEIDLADIKSDDKVLIIGGGAIPCTAINIANKTGAKVDVIDIDWEAINKSKKLIRRLGFEDRINIFREDAKNINVKNYDVVHVALQVNPKKDIIDNIWGNSKSGTRVLLREPKNILKNFYSNISYEYLNNLSEDIKYVKSTSSFNTLDKSLLMIKG